MFFAGLIGTYIVLRFGAPIWPQPHKCTIDESIGAFNTFVLICSSVTIVLGLEAARANKRDVAKGMAAVHVRAGQRVPRRENVRVQRQVLARHISRHAAQPDLRKGRRLLRLGRPRAAGKLKRSCKPKRPLERAGRVGDAAEDARGAGEALQDQRPSSIEPNARPVTS